ncbi:citrate lyase subunit beta/citryl-CoA lyase [Thermocatellispora tengchongensis]|uniref:Citrate lyase subunit beta/citryl-CoA lyase n=1 Tax=Thermocatellispora tengchongensis TaxID=1073253 RepID=A0A840PQR4_9ACTN|nr:CoA ester lyase [Thermocatellispora tengchongensis]MBB5140111.1 citrate lyase subunit beta/citryl-CoA lyase [Thermocatellispora tengchongensis]
MSAPDPFPTSVRAVRLRRSVLATPGSNPAMLAKAAASAADVALLDLEDGVAPDRKDDARRAVAEALATLDWSGKTTAVRINAVDTAAAHADILAVLPARPDLIVVPKVRHPRDVWFVETLLDALEDPAGQAPPIGIEALIEDVAGLTRAEEVARCSPRLEALIFGPGDMAASQGVPPSAALDPRVWAYARSRIVVAARAAGIEAIDGPFPDYRDEAGLLREAAEAADQGYSGKWAIHPGQLTPINRVFAPSAEDVAWARHLAGVHEEALRRRQGATGVDGRMLDAATLRVVQGILAKAELIGPDQEGDSCRTTPSTPPSGAA